MAPEVPEEDTHDDSPFALHHITRQEVFTNELTLSQNTSSLVTPFANTPLPPTEIPEYLLPRVFLRKDPIFPASLLANFALGTLFHMFYALPKEAVQA